MGIFTFAVVIAHIATSVAHLHVQSRPSACALTEGSMPNWHDDSCTTYLKCENLVLTIKSCPEGQAYLLKKDACVTAKLVDCEKQNALVNATLMTSALINSYSVSEDDGDDDDDDDGDDDGNDDDYEGDDDDRDDGRPEGVDGFQVGVANMAGALRRLIEHRSRRVKRQTSEAVESSTPDRGLGQYVLPVALPEAVCQRVDNETALLESLLNAVLLSETDCLANTCKLPLFQLSCGPQDEEEEGIDQMEAETEAQNSDEHESDEVEGRGLWNHDQGALNWLAESPNILRGKNNN